MNYEIKSLLEPIYEFKYKFGDQRAYFLKYLKSLSNMETYFDEDPDHVAINHFFVHGCSKDNKRKLHHPKKDLKNLLQSMIVSDTKDSKSFVIMPFYVKKKICESKNDSRHMMYILYNKNTHELERIDLKKYRIHGFSIRQIYRSMSTKFKVLIYKFYAGLLEEDEIVFIPEHDVNTAFLNKMKHDNLEDCFPLFLITYLNVRNEHPKETYDKIYSRINKISAKKVLNYWSGFLDFYKREAILKACPPEKVRNLETGKCMTIENNKKVLIEKPVKNCKGKLVFNMLTGRCVKKENLRGINIYLEEALGMKVDKDDDFIHLGNDKTVFPTANFVISKHGNAFLIHPSSQSAKKNRLRFSISYRYNDDTKEFDLAYPPRYWEMFKQGMQSSHRFIITLVSLKSEVNTFHANVLIYDKNTNELERFDGLGAQISKYFNIEDFDKQIEESFREKAGTMFPEEGFKYYPPIDYCPRKGRVFQSQEMYEIGSDDERGNCAVWRLWYIDVRIGNPHLTREEVVKYAMKKLDDYGHFAKFIKSYQAYIIDNVDIEGKRRKKQENKIEK